MENVQKETVINEIENIEDENSIEVPEEVVADTPVDGADETSTLEEETAAVNKQDPLGDTSVRNLAKLLKQVGEMVKIMQSTWESSQKEFKLTDSNMKDLYQFNEEHKTEMPDYLSDEDKEKWDHYNGLDAMTEEDVVRIFGEEHSIIGVMHSQTMDRIKSVTNEFFTWLSMLKEYRSINDAYMELVETEEQKKMEQLRSIAENCDDPEKKAKALKTIDDYYARKYLDFLAEPLEEREADRLVKAFYDKRKIEYWLQRSQDKFKQLKISSKLILEISQFEKRFLPEKYHVQDNILLLHVMQSVIYCSCSDIKDETRAKVIYMTIALDRFIRNISKGEERERVLSNIQKFEDQFLEKIKAAASDNKE